MPGEESTEEVRDRVLPALRDCLAALEPGETGLVVLHGACLKVGLMGLLGWPWELSRSLQGPENCGYCVLSEHAVRGGLRLTSYNEKAVGSAARTRFRNRRARWLGFRELPAGPAGSGPGLWRSW